jgi:disulfide bond formation protein DsbB
MNADNALNRRAQTFERTGLGLATLMLLGSLYMSIGMGLKACPLCLYERSLVMAVVGVLGLGVVLRIDGNAALRSPGTLSLLCLPLAFGGLGLAGFHVYLDRSGVLDCPDGVLGIGHAPDQSLAGYVLLTGILTMAALGGHFRASKSYAHGLGAAALGLAFAVASVKSAPPLPPPNPKYDAEGNRVLAGCEPAPPPGFQKRNSAG